MENQKITRIGEKRGGPATARGRAVVSQNAIKHGIFSQKPPLLASEDRDSFQRMTEALVDEFQPQSPSEHILVQQAVMAVLRLYRLWSCEAAQFEEVMLRTEKSIKFSDHLEAAGALLGRLGMARSQKGELEMLEQSINQAAIAASSRTVDTDRLMRLERHLSRQLHESLDRLKQLKSER